ncbi:MAG: hypothetical protein J0I19_02430 [Alphaproteobacteria bacterium]|nr:hypothetical protein [Alphaproteobacteria bacterium]
MALASEGVMGVQGRRRIDARLVMAGLFIVAMIPILAAPILPLIDFYDHVTRFFVLAHLTPGSALAENYRTHWAPIPDIGVDLIGVPILSILAPLSAAKAIAILILAALYSGVLYFHRALTGRNSLLVAVLLLPLLYSYILNWGFANFLLGLGLTFWGAGWWLSTRHNPRLAVPVACIWSVLIYLSHGATFALYGILLASLEIGFYFTSRPRQPRALFRALGLLAVQAIIPAILFVPWTLKMLEQGRAMASQIPPADQLVGVIPVVHNGLHRLSAILRVEEGPAYWFDIGTFVLQAMIGILLLRRGTFTIVRPAYFLIAVAVLLIAVVPSQFLGTSYISDRMPVFGALCLLGALSVRQGQWPALDRAAAGLLIVVAAARLIAVTVQWQGYDGYYKEFRTAAAQIPPRSVTLGVMVGSGHHETNVPRCEMFAPLLVSLYGHAVPLFSDPSQQPLLLTGNLAKARDGLRKLAVLPSEQTKDYNPYMSAARQAGYDVLFVCNRHLLTRPYSPDWRVVTETPHFAVLQAQR